MTNSAVEVAIIGAGPVGLSAAALLQRLATSCVVFDRNPSTSFHPRGHVITARTMEIFRQIGIENEISSVSLPIEKHAGVGFMTSLSGEEIGVIWTRPDRRPELEELAISPCLKRSCPQDMLEPVLRRHVESVPGHDLRFSTEITAILQRDDRVDLHWRAAGGETGTCTAKYVIAADGARSFAREQLGVGASGGSMGQQIGVYFKADLLRFTKGRPYLLWWIYNATTSGVFISLDGRYRWTYNFAYGETDNRQDFTRERCEAIIKAAIGSQDVDIDIQSIMPWRMQARIADKFQSGRVFFAGDAAHPLPPTGGQGMNTGIADVHNLAWKLALVLRGDAPAAILETYGEERMPIARFNVAQSVRNAEKMAASGLAGMLSDNKDVTSRIESDESDVVRARLAAAIPDQREHFDYPGQTFGYVYRSALIADDGAEYEPHSVRDYIPSARPGQRAPHFWLAGREGTLMSSLDLFALSEFTLLVGADGKLWKDAFSEVLDELGLSGRAHIIEKDDGLRAVDADWLELYGIQSTGAVLVRPDGHVAWRASSQPDDVSDDLRRELQRATGRFVDARKVSIPAVPLAAQAKSNLQVTE
ncbi:FAD-dependent monooxygenase [Mesorhizobium sp. J428]|uniref:FAD-dependent monooxygenase n=1 Tax=Mesorhizobium sp. J428 TaxID=2898440 RepID=UPI002150A141|nr:FAD-dependent monooxygenase [Mesorhizobium sp. J428]MCR5857974.1 FAD-dependent monooxygenase [Mesorhizobium sp. J428]